jgi:hypothetical protein
MTRWQAHSSQAQGLQRPFCEYSAAKPICLRENGRMTSQPSMHADVMVALCVDVSSAETAGLGHMTSSCKHSCVLQARVRTDTPPAASDELAAGPCARWRCARHSRMRWPPAAASSSAASKIGAPVSAACWPSSAAPASYARAKAAWARPASSAGRSGAPLAAWLNTLHQERPQYQRVMHMSWIGQVHINSCELETYSVCSQLAVIMVLEMAHPSPQSCCMQKAPFMQGVCCMPM